MNRILAFVATGFLITSPCHAQWARIYHGSGYDGAYAIHQTSEGGYVVAGETDSFGAGYIDFWVIKLTTFGAVEWQKSYGGSGYDGAYAIQQTTEGGYVVAGETDSFGASNGDFWILKLDSAGAVEWQKTYGGSGYDGALAIQQTAEGGYVVAGLTDSFGAGFGDFWILKLDSAGAVEWQKTYGGSTYDSAYAIQQTAEGGYVVAGETLSFGYGVFDAWILKLNALGAVEWQKTYGGSGYDGAYAIQQTSEGGYVVAGLTYSFGAGDADFWVLKLGPLGTVQWQKTYGGSSRDNAYSIHQSSDGGYVVAGVTESFGVGLGDLWMLKVDSAGAVEWQKSSGGTKWDAAYSIQSSDGGYVVAGFGSSVSVLKVDANGEIPDCDAIVTSLGTVSDTSAAVAGTSVLPQDSGAVLSDTDIYSQDTSLEMTVICGKRPPIADGGPDRFILSVSQSGTFILGSASDPDNDPMFYRWLEWENELSSWHAVGGDGEAYLDLSALPLFALGAHTLTLEVSDSREIDTDEMILTVNATVGGTASPINKIELMASWITVITLLFIGLGLLVLRKYKN